MNGGIYRGGGGHFAPISAPDLTTENSYVQYGVSDQLTLATVVIHTSLVGPIKQTF